MKSQELTTQDKWFWLKLMRTQGVGPLTFAKLLQTYISAENALRELPKLAKLKGRQIVIPSDANIDDEMRAIENAGAQLLAMCETTYPFLLKQIANPPPLLSLKGNIDLLKKPCMAMVGARNASASAMRLAHSWSAQVSQNGWIICSGLARGIDRVAHEAALEGGTIAVIAGGLGNIYPPENKKLYQEIAERGLIISESAYHYEPKGHDFPRRNRIISGLCMVTLVVEASLRSGSLITARCATEQGREVFAIPGSPADPRSAGTNQLIKEGAQMIISVEDLIENLTKIPEKTFAFEENPTQIHFHKKHKTLEDDIFCDETETLEPQSDQTNPTILSFLSLTPIHIEDLSQISGIPSRTLNIELLELEMNNKIERLPGGKVALKSL